MTGRVALPSRRSLATGLPRVSSLAVRSSTSYDLEGHAEVAAVVAKLLLDRVGDAREHRAEAHGDAEEAGGLAVDELVVFRLGHHAAECLGLQQFAFHHLLGQADKQVQHLEVALLER